MRNLIFIIATLAACDSSSKTDEFCNRADHCNALKGSVEECVESLDKQLDNLTSTERDELLLSVQMCLDHPSCNAFTDCIGDLANEGRMTVTESGAAGLANE